MIGGLKKFRVYSELRYIYRSFAIYRKLISYLYYRFVVGPKLRRLSRAIDRPAATQQYSVHMLCNHDGLDLLLWSLLSWYRVVEQTGQVYLHEDGTFTPDDRKLINRLLPSAKIIERAWATKQIKEWLASYPVTRSFREYDDRYIFALKLVDPYFVSPAPAKLVLDIDVLWFKKPEQLLDMLLLKNISFMIKSQTPMEYVFASGEGLPAGQEFANGGIVGYQLGHFSLDRLEEFIQRNGPGNPSRLIDQAGYVNVLARSGKFEYLNEEDYTLKPKPDPVVRHYTGPVREKFWFEGVKHVWHTRI